MDRSGQEGTPVQHIFSTRLKGYPPPFKNDVYIDVVPTQRREDQVLSLVDLETLVSSVTTPKTSDKRFTCWLGLMVFLTHTHTLFPGYAYGHIVVWSKYVWSAVYSLPCLTTPHRSTSEMSSTMPDCRRYLGVAHKVECVVP